MRTPTGMRAVFYTCLFVGLLAEPAMAASVASSAAPIPSAQAWPTGTPEDVGIDSVPLVEMFDFVRERQIPVHSIQLVRGGRLGVDAYFFPYDGQARDDL